MTESLLIKKFFLDKNNKDFFRIEKLYSETSKFVHFSFKHVNSIYAPNDKGLGDEYKIILSDVYDAGSDAENEVLESVLWINKALFKYTKSWIETDKKVYKKVEDKINKKLRESSSAKKK